LQAPKLASGLGLAFFFFVKKGMIYISYFDHSKLIPCHVKLDPSDAKHHHYTPVKLAMHGRFVLCACFYFSVAL